jgi:hypothetical protein
MCLHFSFVPGTLTLDMCTIRALVLDTSTVRAHCVHSVPVVVECFLLHSTCFFFLVFTTYFFGPCLTYIFFIERPPIPTRPGYSSWTASPVQQSVFEAPTSEDYNTGETPPLEFQLDDLFRDTTDKISGTQLSGAPPVDT